MRHFFCHCFLLVSVVAFLLATSGCRDGKPQRVPISGQVLIDGKPLTRGHVHFNPRKARMSQGKLDENGRFTLGCFEVDDGAVVGSHKVAVVACESIGEIKMKWYTPKKYSNPGLSELTEEITGPNDNLTINLTWK